MDTLPNPYSGQLLNINISRRGAAIGSGIGEPVGSIEASAGG